jgi:hypothetical protein
MSPSATLAAAGRQLSAGSTLHSQQSLQFYQQQQQRQQQQQQSMGSPWRSLASGRLDSTPEDGLAAALAAAAAAGMAPPPPPPPPPYSHHTSSTLNRASTATAQQLFLQQQQQQQLQQQTALARSLSVDVGVMSAGGGYLGMPSSSNRWGSGRLSYDTAGQEHQGRFGSVFDMKR